MHGVFPSLPPLPPMPGGPRSTICEVQRWITVPVAEALANGERSLPTAFQSDDKMPGKPSNPTEPLCDVRRWVTITVKEALRTEEVCRCVECKMPVRPHHASADGMAAHFEHRRRNPACSLSHPR
jgi:hypothetical protein